MRPLAPLVLAVLFGCASSNTIGSHGDTQETVRIETPTGTASITRFVGATPSTIHISAPIDSAWKALLTVYASLEIPISMADPGTHLLGSQNVKVRRSLGKVPLSRYLDCGRVVGISNADTYDVYLSVATQLVPEGSRDRITVSTAVQASARPPSGVNTNATCGSTGVLESRIGAMLREHLKA